ncbi:MAG: PqqD family protein [Oscillospiraceae bacterium]|jgi:hypothetical protein|nr:PqqD family protein [Oscillospiraceae bacterium]
MKLAEGFILRKVTGKWVILPTSNEIVDISRIPTLNDSAALLWQELEKGAESAGALAHALMIEYDIDYETALKDSEEFIDHLKKHGLLE